MSAVFEYGWREDHARAGDAALVVAQEIVDREDGETGVLAQAAQAWAAIAQAHYAAANIRTRPIRDDSPLVPEGAHIRLNGWCEQCGGLGRSGVQHVDTRTVGR